MVYSWFHYASIALKLACNRNKLFKFLHYWSRDMLNLHFLDKVWKKVLQHILCMIFQQKWSSCYILIIDQISLAGCLKFLRYWAIGVLQLLLNQVGTSLISKLTWSFSSSCFYTWPKSQGKNLKTLRTKRAFNAK